MNETVKAHLALFFVAAIYGFNYIIAKEVLVKEYLHPFAFIFLRVTAACLLFGIFHQFFIKEKISRKDVGRLVLCGLFGVAINQLFFFSGLKLTSPVNASLIMTTNPITVLVISFLLINEPITSRKIGGIILGAAGAILLITYGKSVQFNQEGLLGDLLILTNATSYGIYLVLVKSLMKKYNPITIVFWVFVFGLLFVIPVGIPELIKTDWSLFTPLIWAAVGYVLLFTTFFAYLFNAYALKTVNPSVVSIYIYLQPLIASTLAFSLGMDQLTWEKIAAGALIFTGVFLVSVKKKERGFLMSQIKEE